VVNAEVDGSDEAEGKDPPRVVDDLHRLAEPEVLVGGGGRVHGDLAWAAGQVSGRDRETPQRRVAGDVDADARQFPVPDDLAAAADEGRPPHQAPGGRLDPAGRADLGQHGGGTKDCPGCPAMGPACGVTAASTFLAPAAKLVKYA
jgi:hypothetical protein